MEIVLARGKLLTSKQCLNVAFTRFWKPQPLQTISTRKMSSDDWKSKETLYEFSATDIDGKVVRQNHTIDQHRFDIIFLGFLR